MQEGELVEENAPTDGEDEVAELGHDARQVGHHQDLGRDDAGNAHGRDPHDNAHHPDDGRVHVKLCIIQIIGGDIFLRNAPRLCFQ